MDDDVPQRTWRALRPVGRGLVGGELQLTETHVVFEPKGPGASVDGLRFSIALKHLAAVGIVSGRGGWFTRRIDRFCLTLGDGSQWELIVDDLSDAVQTIQHRLADRA
ncbi:MAG: hypothetical protein QM809_04305 [Gordonia sp. (in: high G+C Gram-positive bacteria)]|uniref:hypothetical protein n=1 Tax=Gordonia sp. (in: high G+C Gram-positive bacteria) TaxID=84139 RepID=UPI0039E66DAC